MNCFSLISFISAFLSLFLGFLIYSLNRKKKVNRLYFLFSFFLFCWAFPEFMRRQAQSFERAQLWVRLSFLWPFVIATLIHFTLVFTEKKEALKNKINYFFIYVPAVFISCIVLLTPWWTPGPVKMEWGYTYRLPYNMILHNASNLWAASGVLLSLILFVSFYFKGKDKKKKRQIFYISCGLCITLLAGGISQALLPAFNMRVPEMATASFSVLCIFVSWAVWKHGLFSLDLAEAADTIIGTMEEPLMLLSSGLKVIRHNRALSRTLGYKHGELKGKDVSLILADGGRWFSEGEGGMRLARGESFKNRDTLFKSKSGEKIVLNFSFSPIMDKGKRTVSVLGVGKDLRRIEKLQLQLLNAEKMTAISRLAGGVAHELNNPMGVIVGFAQSIMKRIEKDDPLYHPLKSINREASRCRKLIGELLSFSHKRMLEKEESEIKELVEETLALVENGAREKGVKIKRDYSPDLPEIKVERQNLKQAVMHICENAIDFMTGGGELEVSLFAEKDKEGKKFICLNIRDSGPGIKEREERKIFEPFFTTKEVGRGAGLGLSFVYDIVSRHGGSIEAENIDGGGALFKMRLPVLPGPEK